MTSVKQATEQKIARLVRQRLRGLADAERAAKQRAYVKSSMPCFGIDMPALRRTCLEIYREHELSDPVGWQRTILALWREARHREERYAAIELLRHRRCRRAARQRTEEDAEDSDRLGAA